MHHSFFLSEDSGFESYPVDQLLDNSTTDFDLFVQIEGHLVLYSGSGYRWTRDELTGLLRSGHEALRVRRSDLKKAEMYRACASLPKIRKELAPFDRMREIERLGAEFTKCLFDGELTTSCVDKARLIASDLTDCVLEDRRSVQGLLGLMDHDLYTYHHSIRVAAFTVATAVSMGMTDSVVLKELALGGIFHDVGKREVPDHLLHKRGALTEEEWGLLRAHPTAGHDSLKASSLSLSAREIVLHHHEKRNGSGYPHGLDRNQLLPEVQIATIANIFDALTSARAYQCHRSKFEALEFMKHKLLGSEVCPEAFKGLVGCLAGE